MIIGAHTILYSENAEADRAFLRDVLKFTHLDVGRGWPADVDALHAALGHGMTVTMPPTNEPWDMRESGNKAIRRFDTIPPFP